MAAACEPALQDLHELRLGEGLREVVIHPGREALLPIPLHGMRRECHYDPRRSALLQALLFPDQAGGGVAVHDRHLAVHEDQVEAPLAHEVHSLGAVVCYGHAAAGALQHRGRDVLVHIVVLHQQDAGPESCLDLPTLQPGNRSAAGAYAKQVDQGAAQAGLPHRLGDVTRYPRLAGLGFVAILPDRGGHEEPRLREGGLRLDGAGQLDAVHPGHVHVEDGDVIGGRRVGCVPEQVQRRAGVVRHVGGHPPGYELVVHDPEVCGVVVHDQRPEPEQGGGRGQLGAGLLGRFAQPEREPEGGACADFALHAYGPPHHFDQLPGYGESETGAAEFAGGRVVGLREAVEDAPLHLRSDADAGVRHLDHYDYMVFPFLLQGGANDDFTLFGELYGVADQVHQDLVHADLVSQEGGGDVALHQACDLQTLAVCGVGEEFDHVGNGFGKVEVRLLQFQLPRLDLREVEDVVDDAKERLPGAAHRRGEACLPFVQPRAEQQVGHAEHAVHGRADLVAHVGQELGFRPGCGLGRLDGDLQLAHGRFQLPGALGDLQLQRAAVAGQFLVAGLDLAQHLVEAVHQRSQLVGGALFDANGVVLVVGDPLHGAGEFQDRARDEPLQPQGDQIGTKEAGEHDQQGGFQHPDKLSVQLAVVSADHHRAEFLPLHADIACDHHVTVEIPQIASGPLRAKGHRVLRLRVKPGGAVRREGDLPLGQKMRLEDEALVAQGFQGLLGVLPIPEYDRGGAVVANYGGQGGEFLMRGDAGRDEGGEDKDKRSQEQRDAAGQKQDQHQFFSDGQAIEEVSHGTSRGVASSLSPVYRLSRREGAALEEFPRLDVWRGERSQTRGSMLEQK